MRLRSLGLIITALVAVAAWGVGTSAEPLGEAGVISLRSLPPLMEEKDCGYCRNCEDPGKHEFENDENGPDRAYGEDNHSCETPNWSAGSCPSRHPESLYCNLDPPPLEPVAQLDFEGKQRLWTLLATDAGSAVDLPTALEELGEAVVFNRERGAVQVHGGCDGSLITMSIPLGAEQLAQLEGSDR